MDQRLRNNNLEYIETKSPDFYRFVHDEIDSDIARLKKNVEIMKKLRMTAAETEVETAALYHAELWSNIEELKILIANMTIANT